MPGYQQGVTVWNKTNKTGIALNGMINYISHCLNGIPMVLYYLDLLYHSRMVVSSVAKNITKLSQ